MDLAVRPTAAGDLAAITAIYRDAVLTGVASFEIEPPAEAEMTRRWQSLLASGHPHIVAVRDGGVLGYAYAGPHRARPAYRFTVEDSIYVAAQGQRRGVGRALLAELLALSEARGFRQMIAVIGGGAENAASIGLHAALGFRRIGTIEGAGFKHGRWLDSLLMQRALGAGNSAPPGALSR